jgi:ribose transport system permease protein
MTADTVSPVPKGVTKMANLGRRRFAPTKLSGLGLPALLVAFILVFSTLSPTTFATFANAKTVLSTQSVLAVLALAALLTLVVGEFDLSLGAQMGLSALLVPGLSANHFISIPLAVAAAVVATTLVGLLNGLLVTKLKISSFIATIGTAALIGALVLAYSGGSVIFDGVPPQLLHISLFAPFGVPAPIIYVAVIGLLIWALLERTPWGRYMFAVGGSKDAARLSGINTELVTLVTFTLAGCLTGLAGVIESGQLGSGNPSVGPSFLLPAFAAAFLGATSFRVGQFNVWGTLTAVVTIATGVAGLNILGMPDWAEPAFNGFALLVAVTLTRYLRGRPL